jgi:hypothetical protein
MLAFMKAVVTTYEISPQYHHYTNLEQTRTIRISGLTIIAFEKSSFEISSMCRPVPILAPARTTAQKKVKDTYQAISHPPIQEAEQSYKRKHSKPVVQPEQSRHKKLDIAPQAHCNPR